MSLVLNGVIMKFIRVKKRRFYKTWEYHDKRNNCTIYIYLTPKGSIFQEEFYHFTVIGDTMNFSSISNHMLYKSFDECVKVIIEWRKENFK
jgi:hypothetical protein